MQPSIGPAPLFVASILAWAAAVAADITVSTSTFAANGTLANQPSHTSVSNYGIKPTVLINANEDNSFDVGLHLSGTSRIQVLSFDKDGARLGRLLPDSLAGA